MSFQERPNAPSTPVCCHAQALLPAKAGTVVVGCTGRGLFGVQDGQPVELDPQPKRGQRAQRAATGRPAFICALVPAACSILSRGAADCECCSSRPLPPALQPALHPCLPCLPACLQCCWAGCRGALCAPLLRPPAPRAGATRRLAAPGWASLRLQPRGMHWTPSAACCWCTPQREAMCMSAWTACRRRSPACWSQVGAEGGALS